MVQEIVLFPRANDESIEVIDRFIEKYIIPAHEQSPGLRSLTVNRQPLMSPFGAPTCSRVIVAALDSLDDITAIGSSALILESRKETPEGMQVIFYEYDQ